MGKRQFVNKKNATTFQLVHRSQRDPEIHNEEASQRVFVPIQTIEKSSKDGEVRSSGRKTIQTKAELAADFDGKVRENEGEAAEYGVYYDDTSYDYMQHLRPTGNMGAVMLENPAITKAGKKKTAFELPEDVKPSAVERPHNYQDQQAVQDSITGFRPDMDPRIREVLEALEDETEAEEADSEDWFQELTKGGVVAEEESDDFSHDDWGAEEDEEGWDSDDTAKAAPTARRREPRSEWEQEFSVFKRAGADAIEEEGSIVSTAFTAASTGRIKHGNGSIGTGFSMSSSALYRNEGLTLLDDRFDRVEREYDIEEEDEDEPQFDPSAPVRTDFDSIMDDFLGEYANMGQKGTSRRARNPYTLDDARIALGNTRLSEKKAVDA